MRNEIPTWKLQYMSFGDIWPEYLDTDIARAGIVRRVFKGLSALIVVYVVRPIDHQL